MEIGVHVPQVGPNGARDTMTAFAQAADAAGFDGLWVFDHVVLQKEQHSGKPPIGDGRPQPRLESLHRKIWRHAQVEHRKWRHRLERAP